MPDDDFVESLDRELVLSAEMYRAIGRFVVEFEWLCSGMGSAIIGLLGVEYGEDRYSGAEIVLGDVQAGGLLTRLSALAARMPDAEDAAFVKNICARIDKVIQRRNDTIHALWYLDRPIASDERAAEGRVRTVRRRHTPRGIVPRSKDLSPEELNLLAEEAADLGRLLSPVESLWE